MEDGPRSWRSIFGNGVVQIKAIPVDDPAKLAETVARVRRAINSNEFGRQAVHEVALLALTKIDAALYEAGFDDADGPVAWLHDEIVMEVPVDRVQEALHLLEQAMIAAFVETFPERRLTQLVNSNFGTDWEAAKRKTKHKSDMAYDNKVLERRTIERRA